MDAAAIDSQVLAIELRDRPALADEVRVIGAIGLSTIQPIVVSSSRLSPAGGDHCGRACGHGRGCSSSAALMDAAFVERFVAMDGTGYDDIRRMLGRCRAQVSSVDSGGPTGLPHRSNRLG